MEFIRLEPAEQQRWRDKVSPVREQLIQQLNAKAYNGSEIVADILQWAKHYADFSADELMQESLDHPFTDLLP
jgi:hypothetical protein